MASACAGSQSGVVAGANWPAFLTTQESRAEAGLSRSRRGSVSAGGGLKPRLIVDRRINGEIGDELFLSAGTVETHVRHIFRKLDADSRVEVAGILERSDRLAGSVG